MSKSPSARLIGYSLFDFANSAFVLIIHAYLFPLYFRNHLFGGHPSADAIWGACFSGSVAIAALIAPLIGRIADRRGRYRFFCGLAALSFSTTFLLAGVLNQAKVVVVGVFILTNVAFYLAANVYDSLISIVATQSERVRFSSFAWGFGYLGGVLCFVGVYLLQRSSGEASFAPYALTAAFYAVFGTLSLAMLRGAAVSPILAKVPDQIVSNKTEKILTKSRLELLVGYWLIGDCLNAIIFFTAIYASNELGLSTTRIGALLLFVQVLAFPATWLMGRLANQIGVRSALQLCVVIWCLIIALLVLHVGTYGLILMSVMTAFVIGSTQALMRAQYSLTIGSLRISETFGWYAIVTESSAILAPLLFGLTSWLLHSQRIAMGLLALPLLFGITLIRLGERSSLTGSHSTIA